MRDKTKREQIVEAADLLFYQQGFDHTSFAHIAQAVSISRGNFYYHFKTKDEILQAVIDYRLDKTRQALNDWSSQATTPLDCIRSFIGILIMNRGKISRYGCPIGTLCSELGKLEHPALGDANRLFTLFRDWLRFQFESLGQAPSDAEELAMHLLARSQGIATLASAFHDESFIDHEVEQLHRWLETVTNPSAQLQ